MPTINEELTSTGRVKGPLLSRRQARELFGLGDTAWRQLENSEAAVPCLVRPGSSRRFYYRGEVLDALEASRNKLPPTMVPAVAAEVAKLLNLALTKLREAARTSELAS